MLMSCGHGRLAILAICCGWVGASTKPMSAPASRNACARSIAGSKPSIATRVDCGFDLGHHLDRRDHLLALEMPAALREHLVLDLDRVGAGALEQLDGTPHVERVAESGVGIDHQRAGEDGTDRGNVVDQLGQGDQAVVGDAEIGVGNPGTGHIGGRKAAVGNHAGGKRIGDARQDQRRAGDERGAELTAGRAGHFGFSSKGIQARIKHIRPH
jgi:hypothetical protein